jgi:hypothetical protein
MIVGVRQRNFIPSIQFVVDTSENCKWHDYNNIKSQKIPLFYHDRIPINLLPFQVKRIHMLSKMIRQVHQFIIFVNKILQEGLKDSFQKH